MITTVIRDCTKINQGDVCVCVQKRGMVMYFEFVWRAGDGVSTFSHFLKINSGVKILWR